MPVTPTYPGVYVEEIPSGVRTIVGVATSITAFVGFTQRGPLNRPVRIFNIGDYERTFGDLSRESEVSYAVRQFYLNGGGEAHVVRVAQGAETAQVNLGDGVNDPAATPVLEVRAADPGGWGNGLRLDVDYATENPDSSFNLTATRYEQRSGSFVPTDSEVFRNLSMNSEAAAYAPDTVNATSRLVRLSRPDGLSFESGFSLSRDLSSSFPDIDSTTTLITGSLNGAPFELVLTAPFPTDVASTATAIATAITSASLDADLSVVRADADGADNAAGNHIKLVSASTAETSEVRIATAPSNDAARPLGLGLTNGGREFSGARGRRPAMTGTTSADLVDSLGTPFSTPADGAINVTITNAAGDVLPATALSIPTPATIGPGLAAALQTRLRLLNDPATRQATVTLVGSRLQVRSSAADPGAILSFSGAGATALGLTGAGASENAQQFSLGSGSRGTQAGAVTGRDGSPPGAAELLESPDDKLGIYALQDVDLFNLLVIPGTTRLMGAEASAVIAAAVTFCEQRRAMLLIDPPAGLSVADVGTWAAEASTSRNAAIFYPHLDIPDPLSDFRPRPMPPSGTVAGIFARTDTQRGVWKAPAGTEAVVQGSVGPSRVLTDDENGVLNPLAVNCIRKFPVYNTVLWGARTRRGADALADEYKYVPVRRLALFLEETLFRNLKWVVFEPNDEPLWAQIRLNVGAFMQNLFRQGAFQGSTPREAYLVKCDSETTTQNDINLGIVNIVVGFAPLKPAEFVIIKLQQLAGQIEV